ncbi:putative Acyl carrier protein (ACP) [Helianthus annuus]|nr:putative Acyl carrier protein (ACP) [Helianthus annuus]KAJ0955863.1 putative Acyl carrier protein (ACP) [Helianthus annuus]
MVHGVKLNLTLYFICWPNQFKTGHSFIFLGPSYIRPATASARVLLPLPPPSAVAVRLIRTTRKVKILRSQINMQSLRDSVLTRLRVTVSRRQFAVMQDVYATSSVQRLLCTLAGSNHDQVMARVIGLVKKFDKIDAAKVTESADFSKDLSLDSLDRVELVMAFEQEFSIEIPDEEADKLKCCADVANYIQSAPKSEDS